MRTVTGLDSAPMEASPDEPGGKRLTALIDKEQLAYKLQLRPGDVVAHSKRSGFPAAVAYFRGAPCGTRQPSTAGSASTQRRSFFQPVPG